MKPGKKVVSLVFELFLRIFFFFLKQPVLAIYLSMRVIGLKVTGFSTVQVVAKAEDDIYQYCE